MDNSEKLAALAEISRLLEEGSDLRNKLVDVITKERAAPAQAVLSMLCLAATGAVFTNMQRDAFLLVCEYMYFLAGNIAENAANPKN